MEALYFKSKGMNGLLLVIIQKDCPPQLKILELLLLNIHGFMQLLCNRYFEVLVDHKAIEYRYGQKQDRNTDNKIKDFVTKT